MLELLSRYAHDQGLTTEPGFTTKRVRWSLVFEPSGRFLIPLEMGDLSAKRNRGEAVQGCPHLSQGDLKRGGAGCRHFLVDSADVVALLEEEPDPKLLAKHRYFIDLLRQGGEAMPVLAALAEGLEDPEQLERIRQELLAAKAKGAENVTFAIDGWEPPLLARHDEWRDWWRGFRKRYAAPVGKGPGAGARMRCLVSGQLARPARTHPNIRGLSDVGGLSMGDVLASFKQEAFQSYGLEQSANAAVTEAKASEYTVALNHLIEHTGQRLGGVKVVHWFKKKLEQPETEDPFALLAGLPGDDSAAAQARARQLLESIPEGKRPYLANNHYYAMVLNGASGRVMLREWIDGPFEDLLANVLAWFDDLSIVHRSGHNPAPTPKLMAVAGALVRDLGDLPAPSITTLWRVAVRKRAIPRTFMAQVLRRVQLDILTNQTPRHARLGLLKAFHLREGDTNMQPVLNQEHPHKAYQCGRLMAVLAQLQYRALGDVGAGVVQRYYAAASATPAMVLGRLMRGSNFHLRKLKKGSRIWFENQLAEVFSRIEDSLPKTLDLSEQSLFALGYYQQMAHDRASKGESQSEESNVSQEEQENA